jgi:hypothetical protein
MNKRPRLTDTPSQAALSNDDSKTAARAESKSDSNNRPFNYLLYSKATNETFSSRGARPTRYSIEVTLSIPADEDECPLTLDSIAESRLPSLPDIHFLKDRPLHTKLTLPCGHSFSAMTLVYSFCKNNMTCPCCRTGEDVQADTRCLPIHFRAQLKAQIQETLESERRLDESDAHRDIVDSFSIFGVTIPYEVLGTNGNLSIVANFYDIPAGISSVSDNMRPILSFINTVDARRENNGQLYLMPRGPLRALTHIAQMGVNAIQLSMRLTLQGIDDILIDSTPITRLPDLNNYTAPLRFTIPGVSGSSVTENGQFRVLVQLQRDDPNNPASTFSVLFSRAGAFGQFVLDNITWNPGSENLEMISSA